MSRALVVYATRSGSTKKMAELIGEGIKSAGAEAEIKEIKKIKNAEELNGYDAVVFGSATYHGEMLKAMKQLLFLAEKTSLENVVGGAFGAFGWSGEAPDRIFETMANIFKMNMVAVPLRVKSPYRDNGDQQTKEYGQEIGKKLNNYK